MKKNLSSHHSTSDILFNALCNTRFHVRRRDVIPTPCTLLGILTMLQHRDNSEPIQWRDVQRQDPQGFANHYYGYTLI